MHFSLTRITGGVLFGAFFVCLGVVPRWLLGLPLDSFPLFMGLGGAAMGIWMWPFVATMRAIAQERRGPRKIDWSRVSWQNKFWLLFTPALCLGSFLFMMLMSGDRRIWIWLAAYAGVAVIVSLIARYLERRFPEPKPAWAGFLGSGLYLGFIVASGLIFLDDAPLDWPRLILAGLVSGLLIAVIWAAIQRVAVRWVQEQNTQLV